MSIKEDVNNNRKFLIQMAILISVIAYLTNKYKIVHRDQFNNMCGLLAALQQKGYIHISDGGYIRIIEGLTLPTV